MPREICSGEPYTVSQLGARVRAARELRGVSMRCLAKAIGYESFSIISHIEHGKKEPSVSKLVAIANELGVPVDHLLGRGEHPSLRAIVGHYLHALDTDDVDMLPDLVEELRAALDSGGDSHG